MQKNITYISLFSKSCRLADNNGAFEHTLMFIIIGYFESDIYQLVDDIL